MPSTQEFEEFSCYLLPGHTTTPDDAIEEAQQAELLGLGRVWLSQRFDVKDAVVIHGSTPNEFAPILDVYRTIK